MIFHQPKNFVLKDYKKIFLVPIFFLFSIFSLFSHDFPEHLSNNAKISILFVNYNDISHSLFSKSCLRIYDAETNFDQLIDFAHFENFDDEFFLLKFYLKEKKAYIRAKPFFDYFMRQSKRTNVSLSESVLSLSPAEVAYIFQFISIMHKALPEYNYDFDILTNNSETHISHILHDCARMFSNESTSANYLFSKIAKPNLNYIQSDDNYILSVEKEFFEFQEPYFSNDISQKKFPLIITLIIFWTFIFLLSAYQIFAYFFEKIYLASIFKTTQILDFLLLFFSGLAGTIILYQDIFSNQSLFRNNFEFFFLFPLHIIAAFTIFKPIQNKKIKIYYWSIVSIFSFLYIFIYTIISKKLPTVCFLISFSIFLRTIYFDFIAIDIKTIFHNDSKNDPAEN